MTAMERNALCPQVADSDELQVSTRYGRGCAKTQFRSVFWSMKTPPDLK
jgi:hypothetical protein